MKIGNVISFNIIKYLFIFLGSIMTAVGIEVFFKAHNLIGGGIIGISVVLRYLTEIPLGVILIILNFPIILIEFFRQGKRKLLPILFASISFMYWISVINIENWETHNILQSTILGGICLGVGSGLILRYGGFLDGIEYKRMVLKFSMNYSINKYFILVNLLIIFLAGILSNWENTIYSLIAYIIVFKVIDFTLEIFRKTIEAVIFSSKCDELAENIFTVLGKRVTFINTETEEDNRKAIATYISNYELGVIRTIIRDVDSNATITLSDKYL